MRFLGALGRVAAIALVVFGLLVVPAQSVQAAPSVGDQPAVHSHGGGWIQVLVSWVTGGPRIDPTGVSRPEGNDGGPRIDPTG